MVLGLTGWLGTTGGLGTALVAWLLVQRLPREAAPRHLPGPATAALAVVGAVVAVVPGVVYADLHPFSAADGACPGPPAASDAPCEVREGRRTGLRVSFQHAGGDAELLEVRLEGAGDGLVAGPLLLRDRFGDTRPLPRPLRLSDQDTTVRLRSTVRALPGACRDGARPALAGRVALRYRVHGREVRTTLPLGRDLVVRRCRS